MKETNVYRPDEVFLDDLRRVAGLYPDGRLTETAYKLYGQFSMRELRLRFGGFKEAITAAAIKSEPPLKQLKALSFWSEEYCLDFLRKVRWPDGVKCPRCEDGSAIRRLVNQVHSNKALYTYACIDCAYHFTDFTGTFLHKSATRMRDWLRMIFLSQHRAADGIRLNEQARILGMDDGIYRAKVRMIGSSRLAGELGKRLMEELT